MGETALVEAKIADSLELLRKLDTRGEGPGVAAWYFYEDAEQWRLLVAGTAFDAWIEKQEAVAYRKLAEVFNERSLQSLGMSEIKILRTDSPLLTALRRLLNTGPTALMQAHFTNTTINGIFIKEMVVLRSS
ncbi:MAG TPA: hypothetical protein VLV78_15070 [Thermoanaerobaculia bacterium]|nr:hypothetical protein [Thermoanaerobaculia bacterium]